MFAFNLCEIWEVYFLTSRLYLIQVQYMNQKDSLKIEKIWKRNFEAKVKILTETLDGN